MAASKYDVTVRKSGAIDSDHRNNIFRNNIFEHNQRFEPYVYKQHWYSSLPVVRKLLTLAKMATVKYYYRGIIKFGDPKFFAPSYSIGLMGL